MPYRLTPDETLDEGLRRIAVEQIEAALDSLLAVRATGDPAAVHDVRKRTKKVRAVAKLVRATVGDEEYRAVNLAARDGARRLSATRDAQVVVETFDELLAWAAASPGVSVDRRRYQGARREVARRLAEASEAAAAHLADDVSHVSWLLTGARGRIELWELPDETAVFSAGLHRAYRRGRRRMSEAKRRPDLERIHEWRKRVKERWYHARIFAEIAPDLINAETESLDLLGEALGSDRDLARLLDEISADPNAWGGIDRSRELARLATVRRAELQARSFELGRQLYAEKPKAATERWGSWWLSWCQRVGQSSEERSPVTTSVETVASST